MSVLYLFALLIIIVHLLYFLVTKKFDYWKKKNVPYVKPLPLLGNYGRYILLQEYVGELVQKLCQKFPNAPYIGAFFGTEPVLIVQSPEVLKQILTKDFYYFNGREISKYATYEIITQNLFFAGGDMWKVKRQMLNPLFSSSKMKNMFNLIEKCCHTFEDMLDRETNVNSVIEVRDFSARYTMDCIMSCAFGVDANTMLQPDNNPFRFIATEIFNSSNYRGFQIVLRSIWPMIFYTLRLQCFPSSIDAFFSKLLKNVFENRNNKPSTRNDFVDQLLNLKQIDIITCESIRNTKTGLDEKIQLKIDDDLLVAQSIMFFGAGFETSSTTTSFTLFELAKNPDVQKRAAEEVDQLLRNRGNKLDYDCINEVPYLKACIYETLRKYPVIGNITREVMDNYTFPDGLHLNKGIRIHIPVYSMHHNPKYFPDPEAYKPERFLLENKEDIKPYTFFPYGEGPRICIGKRFSKLQVLPGLITLLKKYRVELAEGMSPNVKLESRSFLIQPRDQGLMLKFTQREGWEQKKLIRI